MWPYITEAVSKEAQNQLPQLIKDSKPTWMGDITLHKCVSFAFCIPHHLSPPPRDRPTSSGAGLKPTCTIFCTFCCQLQSGQHAAGAD